MLFILNLCFDSLNIPVHEVEGVLCLLYFQSLLPLLLILSFALPLVISFLFRCVVAVGFLSFLPASSLLCSFCMFQCVFMSLCWVIIFWVISCFTLTVNYFEFYFPLMTVLILHTCISFLQPILLPLVYKWPGLPLRLRHRAFCASFCVHLLFGISVCSPFGLY